MREQHALLLGATGLTGHYCLERLLADDGFSQIVALTRRSMGRSHPKLREYIIDFEHLADYGELIKADTVFCCVGATLKTAGSRAAFEKVDYGYVKTLAELAAEHGAQQFLLISAVSANPNSPVFYSRIKGRAEEAVRAQPFRTIHILRPSMLLGPREEPRWNEQLMKPVAKALSPLLLGPLKRLRPVSAERVAAMMVALAKHHEPGVHIHYPSI